VPSKKKLYEKALNNPKGLRFAEIVRLLESFGFRLDRVKGSHCIFIHPAVKELVNIQDVDGKAKPYQVQQVLKLFETYGLKQEL
jgi:predicted RNA binding protein YcfA (HicA-like mRNA interferase family)